MNKTFTVNALQYYYLFLLLFNIDDEIIKPVKEQILVERLHNSEIKNKKDKDFIEYLKNQSNETFELTLSFDELDEIYTWLRSLEAKCVANPIITGEQLDDVTNLANYFCDIYLEMESDLHPETEPLNQVQNDNIKLIA